MKTILLVEDDDDIREAFAEILREHGYDVCEADNGKVALERLSRMAEAPCLVLLDLMMPVMSGPELLRALQDSKHLASIPVVAVSAGGTRQDAPEACSFIRKPVLPDVLVKVVDEFCRR